MNMLDLMADELRREYSREFSPADQERFDRACADVIASYTQGLTSVSTLTGMMAGVRRSILDRRQKDERINQALTARAVG